MQKRGEEMHESCRKANNLSITFYHYKKNNIILKFVIIKFIIVNIKNE